MKTTPVKEINLIAACGLYCGNCGRFKKDKCPGCTTNTKASWCKIRSCCIEKEIANCSACKEFVDPGECAKYNNLISRVIGFFTATDRSLCIDFIQQNGEEKFAAMMTENNKMNLSKRKNN